MCEKASEVCILTEKDSNFSEFKHAVSSDIHRVYALK